MPPKKDLDTATQIDSIFDRTEERSDDSTISRSSDRTTQSSSAEETPPNSLQLTEDSRSREEEKERLPGPYVPESLAWKLDEVHVQLRRATGEKLSQSLIIECALRICLRDYENNGDESILARMIRERV